MFDPNLHYNSYLTFFQLYIKKALQSNDFTLSCHTKMQQTQINQYCQNKITRLDTAVLARLYTTLDCKIEDLLEFISASDNDIKE